MTIMVREAGGSDAAQIATFNAAMALETEGLRLDPQRAAAGVARLLADPALGFYLVAEREGRVVATLMVTTEWSDWRCAQFWWIQSVYVLPALRRQGVFAALYAQVKALAGQREGVCGVRLYVERDNADAQATYAALGMRRTHYLVYEAMREGAAYFAPAAARSD